jgi:hypothetical protein
MRPSSAKEGAYVPQPNPTQYVIAVGRTSINPDGAQSVPAVLGNGTLPGPEIRVHEDGLLRVLVENRLPDSATSIHWHGLLDPAAMDGVPDVSNAPIAPGRMYIYEYPIRQTGTYWYHSHVGFQEQQGFYGAFIIEPRHESPDGARRGRAARGGFIAVPRRCSPSSWRKPRWTPVQQTRGMNPSGQPGSIDMNGGADLRRKVRRLPHEQPRRPTIRGRSTCARSGGSGSSTAAHRRLRVAPMAYKLQVTHADGMASNR